MAFKCPECGCRASTNKGKDILYKRAFKRLYKCPNCSLEFQTEEVLSLKRLRGRPRKVTSPSKDVQEVI